PAVSKTVSAKSSRHEGVAEAAAARAALDAADTTRQSETAPAKRAVPGLARDPASGLAALRGDAQRSPRQLICSAGADCDQRRRACRLLDFRQLSRGGAHRARRALRRGAVRRG